jgi:WD40 repeat protein
VVVALRTCAEYPELANQLATNDGKVNTAEFDDSAERIVSSGDDGTIRIWDAAGGQRRDADQTL